MSGDPADFLDDDALSNVVAYCAQRDSAMADTMREVTLIALDAMGAYLEDTTPRPGCFGGYRWAIGLPKGGIVSAAPVSEDRHVRVELSPAECGAIGYERLLDLLDAVYDRDGHVIEIHPLMDDF